MKLNIEKFMKTEMGAELEETIRCWDKAIEERRKVTPGLSSRTEEDKGMGYHYWNNTCKSCQDRWEVFKLAIHQFYGIEFFFTRTDEYFGICTEDETTWLMKEDRQQKEIDTTFTEEELKKVETEEERQHLIECAADNSKLDEWYMQIMTKYNLWK